MSSQFAPYYLALMSNMAFAWASVVFAHFARQKSPIWINAFKSTVAFLAFLLVYLYFGQHSQFPIPSVLAFLLSGLLGLNIGDWFLMRAFRDLGASRSLILFGFQPLILGIASYFLFEQKIELYRLTAIIFLMACLFTFSLENLRKKGHWGISGILVGLTGISLDAIGVLLTRYGYESAPNFTAVESNFFRCLGATIGFLGLMMVKPIPLRAGFLALSRQNKTLLVTACLSGTFLSLFLYLTAVKIGHLATISAISITGPLFAGIVESFVEKRLPSRYLVASFFLFAIGFLILII